MECMKIVLQILDTELIFEHFFHGYTLHMANAYNVFSGYGHQFTTTPGGRMSCLAYALIGIPLNAILIGSLGSVFSNRVSLLKHFLPKCCL